MDSVWILLGRTILYKIHMARLKLDMEDHKPKEITHNIIFSKNNKFKEI